MAGLHDQLLGGNVGERVEQALERLLMSADGDVEHSEGVGAARQA
jgi:ATP-dependent protease Clp ATPase subunit